MLIEELWKGDEANLLRLPEYPFSVFGYASMTVNKSGFVTIETNKYGLSPALSGETVQAKIFFDHVEFFHDHRPVGSYLRSYKKGDEVYDWTQYVSVLCKKPGATLHTRFFRQMPQRWQTLEQISGRERKNALHCSVKLFLTAMLALCNDALELAEENGSHRCGQRPAVLLHDCKKEYRPDPLSCPVHRRCITIPICPPMTA